MEGGMEEFKANDSGDKTFDAANYERMLFSIRRIIRAVEINSRKLSSEFNVTGPQLVCLTTVVNEGPITATTISKKISLSASTIIGIIDRLEEKRLLERKRDSADRRNVYITATDTGRKLVEEMPQPLRYPLKTALERLSVEEQSHVADLLDRMVVSMGAEQIHVAPLYDIGDSASGK